MTLKVKQTDYICLCVSCHKDYALSLFYSDNERVSENISVNYGIFLIRIIFQK